MKYGYSLAIALLLSALTVYPCTKAAQAGGEQNLVPWTTNPEVSYYQAGDADFSGQVSITDVVFLVNYLFRKGSRPVPFYALGDADCSGLVGVTDVIRLVNYLYRYDEVSQPNLCEFYGRYFLDATGFSEAALMAMWYSEELEPPTELTDRFQSDLARIRIQLWQRQPYLDGVFFWEPWQPSLIRLGVDSITAAAIRDSSYHAWDSLNLNFELDSLEESLDLGYAAYFKLRFAGLKNPEVIAQAYASLPGVTYSAAPGQGGENSNGVWPNPEGDTITYLFHAGWGDCPSGCVCKRFFFVGASSDSVWYIGDWLRVPGQGDPPPAWWSEACINLSRTYWDFLCP